MIHTSLASTRNAQQFQYINTKSSTHGENPQDRGEDTPQNQTKPKQQQQQRDWSQGRVSSNFQRKQLANLKTF